MSLPRPADNAPMIDHALWYASLGWHIMPLHEPIFTNGVRTGCTCEAYRRSEKCRQDDNGRRRPLYDPNYTCKTPGKHPIHGSWEEKATTDPDQIRRWWRVWPNANIGLAVGKSGLLTLDLDNYKESFAGDRLLTRADEETVTQLSGGGGAHLLYAMPEGKTWGNGRGDLPVGIDVRGHGGMQVVAPSLHPSGNRYRWELDYGPGEIDLQPVPDWLASILASAQEKARAVAVHFEQMTTERPDLARWQLTPSTLEAIYQPVAIGGRSEADYRVILALCYAGLDDTEILSIFQHYPIGREGKYAERGQGYLARTIGAARGYMADHPGPEQVRAEVARLRVWVKSTSFADYVPKELQSAVGYRTDATDTKVADALLDVCAERGTFTVLVGLRNLAKRAGVASPQTIANAINRLSGWFLQKNQDGTYTIPSRTLDSLTHHLPIGEVSNLREPPTYSEMKADDLFQVGISRTKREEAKRQAAALGVRSALNVVTETGKIVCKHIQPEAIPYTEREMIEQKLLIKEVPAWRVVIEDVEPGLRESMLRVLDAIEIYGPLSRSRLVDVTGKTKSAIIRATIQATQLGLLFCEKSDSGNVYSLATDWRQSLEELRPHVRTYRIGLEREKRNLEQLRDHYRRRCKQGTGECQQMLNRLLAKTTNRLAVVIGELHPRLREEECHRWAHVGSGLHPLAFSQEIADNQRSEAFVAATQRLSDLVQPETFLTASELAEVRTLAGRWGIDISVYVDSADGYVWGTKAI
jgi:hypothetical protein